MFTASAASSNYDSTQIRSEETLNGVSSFQDMKSGSTSENGNCRSKSPKSAQTGCLNKDGSYSEASRQEDRRFDTGWELEMHR